MNEPELNARIDTLLKLMDQHIADAEANQNRCLDAGKTIAAAFHDGVRSGFDLAKKSIIRWLRDVKPEEVQ